VIVFNQSVDGFESITDHASRFTHHGSRRAFVLRRLSFVNALGVLMETSSVEQHKSPNYIAVFVVLVVLTAIEVGVTYVASIPRLVVLIPLAIAKATLVVLFYMHLRFDSRVFTLIFVIGILMGFSLIVSLLLLFGPPLLDVPK
jgi:cytochrome c oxidase subunit 4